GAAHAGAGRTGHAEDIPHGGVADARDRDVHAARPVDPRVAAQPDDGGIHAVIDPLACAKRGAGARAGETHGQGGIDQHMPRRDDSGGTGIGARNQAHRSGLVPLRDLRAWHDGCQGSSPGCGVNRLLTMSTGTPSISFGSMCWDGTASSRSFCATWMVMPSCRCVFPLRTGRPILTPVTPSMAM